MKKRKYTKTKAWYKRYPYLKPKVAKAWDKKHKAQPAYKVGQRVWHLDNRPGDACGYEITKVAPSYGSFEYTLHRWDGGYTRSCMEKEIAAVSFYPKTLAPMSAEQAKGAISNRDLQIGILKDQLHEAKSKLKAAPKTCNPPLYQDGFTFRDYGVSGELAPEECEIIRCVGHDTHGAVSYIVSMAGKRQGTWLEEEISDCVKYGVHQPFESAAKDKSIHELMEGSRKQAFQIMNMASENSNLKDTIRNLEGSIIRLEAHLKQAEEQWLSATGSFTGQQEKCKRLQGLVNMYIEGKLYGWAKE